MADITYNENSRDAGFEKRGIAIDAPALRAFAVAQEIGSGEDKAPGVALHQAAQPVRARQRADINEKTFRRDAVSGSRGGAVHGDFLEVLFTVDFRDTCLRPDFDIGGLFDLIDQISGHSGGEGFAADDHDNFFRIVCKIDGSPARGIFTPNALDSFPLSRYGFGYAPTPLNALAAETLFTGDGETSPLHAHGEKQRVAGDFAAVGHFDDAVGTFDADAGSLLRRENFDAESSGLHDGAACEVASAEARGKAEIIFDSRAETRLASGGFALDHDRAKAFGCAVNGSRETGRTSADDG